MTTRAWTIHHNRYEKQGRSLRLARTEEYDRMTMSVECRKCGYEYIVTRDQIRSGEWQRVGCPVCHGQRRGDDQRDDAAGDAEDAGRWL
jgi:hypothetical protein